MSSATVGSSCVCQMRMLGGRGEEMRMHQLRERLKRRSSRGKGDFAALAGSPMVVVSEKMLDSIMTRRIPRPRTKLRQKAVAGRSHVFPGKRMQDYLNVISHNSWSWIADGGEYFSRWMPREELFSRARNHPGLDLCRDYQTGGIYSVYWAWK